jgi:hypothetical protein
MKLASIVLVVLVFVSASDADTMSDQQVKSYADAASKAEQALEKVKTDARANATSYRQAAEMRCRQKLESKPEYKAAAEVVAKAQGVLADSRTMSPQARAAADANLNSINAALKKMEADAFAADPDVRAAKAMLERLSGAPQLAAQPPTITTPPIAPAAPVNATTLPVRIAGTDFVPSPVPPNANAPDPKLPTQTHQQPTATLPPGGKLSGEAIGQMIHTAWDQLMAHNYSEATTLFNRAAGRDVRDSTLLTGRGIGEYELKDYKAADKDLDRAYSIAITGGPARVSRQLAIAYVAAEVMNGNPMHAVRILEDMTKPTFKSGKLDEELQNDLGIALSHADSQAHQMELYRDALKYYMDYDKALNEQRHDGTARWGITWIKAASAAAKWQAYHDDVAAADQATVAFQRSGKVMEQANDHYQEITGGLRLHSTAEINMYTNEFHQAIAAHVAAQSQMNAAISRLQSVEKPPFPERIEHEWAEPR